MEVRALGPGVGMGPCTDMRGTLPAGREEKVFVESISKETLEQPPPPIYIYKYFGRVVSLCLA